MNNKTKVIGLVAILLATTISSPFLINKFFVDKPKEAKIEGFKDGKEIESRNIANELKDKKKREYYRTDMTDDGRVFGMRESLGLPKKENLPKLSEQMAKDTEDTAVNMFLQGKQGEIREYLETKLQQFEYTDSQYSYNMRTLHASSMYLESIEEVKNIKAPEQVSAITSEALVAQSEPRLYVLTLLTAPYSNKYESIMNKDSLSLSLDLEDRQTEIGRAIRHNKDSSIYQEMKSLIPDGTAFLEVPITYRGEEYFVDIVERHNIYFSAYQIRGNPQKKTTLKEQKKNIEEVEGNKQRFEDMKEEKERKERYRIQKNMGLTK